MNAIKGLILIMITLGIAGCGNNKNNGLQISLVPQQPVLIPYGSGTTVDGFFNLTAPYFTISSMNVNWTGTGTLNILGILLTSATGATETVNCGFGGDAIKTMFPNNVNGTGQVTLASGSTVSSSPFGCGGVTIPTPIPNFFSIPVKVEMIGAITDNNNNTTGRVTATTNIVIQ